MFAIYGAQGMALGAYKAIKTIFPDQKVDCFLVTERSNNARILGGLPVIVLKDFSVGLSPKDKTETRILVCTPENVMDAIEKKLDEEGLYNHVRITSLRWAEMVKNAFIKSGQYMPLSVYPIGSTKSTTHFYKMVHVLDKKLEGNYSNSAETSTVQVGVALSKKLEVDYFDNIGINISDKNPNYSELTGLYWVWKNQMLKDKSDNSYYGLSHYRRILQLSEDDILRLVDNDIDVILPYPMPYEPNIEMHHNRYLSDKEWELVLQALQELQPDYYEAFKQILRQQYLYNYNVILAKKEVMEKYCEWLFPILFRIEELNSPECIYHPNRFIGYIGETLETLYFMYNKHNYKIAHTGCVFLT